jgi:dihydropteroate synthase
VKLTCGDRVLDIGTRTFVMGIVNVTPDSFSDGGLHKDAASAVDHARSLLDDGADILDIGGESTRPGALPIDVDEELRRVLPVVEGLVKAGARNVSVDTRNARTAQACLDAGASWINDVSALRHDSEMVAVAKRADALVLMHAREMTAGSASDRVRYDDVVGDVRRFLGERMRAAIAGGVAPERIVLDPGIGFGKRVEDNVALTKDLAALRGLGAPILYGASRKRWLGEIAGVQHAAHRDAASCAAACWAAEHGADIVRVHDVKSTAQALRVIDELKRWRPGRRT